MSTIDEIRSMFPQLSEKVYGKPLVYLDNAATSLRPVQVISKWNDLAVRANANIHRAVHHISDIATREYEDAREAVRKFINARSSSEIIFTSGDTNSINLVAFSFGEAFVGEGDRIVVCEAEHHSDIVPWQLMCARKGATLRTFRVDDEGNVDIESLKAALGPETKLVCVTHVSNVLGIVNPIRQIADICHASGVPVLVDGAQGIVHCKVDVRELDCDFYTFSGHKMLAATGTGILYGKRELLEKMPPYMSGGEMIGNVSWNGTTFASVPHKFEAGTQNFNAAPTLVPAISVLESIRSDTEALEKEIRSYVLTELSRIEGLVLYGNTVLSPKMNLFSFTVEGAHHEDLALILDKMGIAVRSGQMCAEPLMDRFGVTGMLRASFAPYNTLQEAEVFVGALRKAVKMLM